MKKVASQEFKVPRVYKQNKIELKESTYSGIPFYEAFFVII